MKRKPNQTYKAYRSRRAKDKQETARKLKGKIWWLACVLIEPEPFVFKKRPVMGTCRKETVAS